MKTHTTLSVLLFLAISCNQNEDTYPYCYYGQDRFLQGAIHPENNCIHCTVYGWEYRRNHPCCNDDLEISFEGCCIDGVPVKDWNLHPEDECLICYGIIDPYNWSGRAGCCIDGVFYPDKTINPQNECEWCDVPSGMGSYDQIDYWTSREAGVPCTTGNCDGKGNCID